MRRGLHAGQYLRVALVATMALLTVGSGTAGAERLPTETLAVTPSPTNGATIEPTTFLVLSVTPGDPSLAFPRYVVSERAVVATESALNPEGVLDGKYVGHEQVAGGKTSGMTWAAAPGTYYWQMIWEVEGINMKTAEPTFQTYLSPVFTLMVVPKPTPAPSPSPAPTPPQSEPSLTASEAKVAIPILIKKWMGHEHRLNARCVGQNAASVICKATWASSQRLTRSTLLYSGDFYLEQQGGSLAVSFVGHRSRYGCKRHGAMRCASAVRWKRVY